MAQTIKEERLRWVLPIVRGEMRLVDVAKVCLHSKRSLERWVAVYIYWNEHFSVLEEEELGLLEANSKWLGQIIITDFKADMRFSWIINLRRKDLNQNFFYF